MVHRIGFCSQPDDLAEGIRQRIRPGRAGGQGRQWWRQRRNGRASRWRRQGRGRHDREGLRAGSSQAGWVECGWQGPVDRGSKELRQAQRIHARLPESARPCVGCITAWRAQIYAGQLGSYLAIDQATATPEEVEAAREKLESAALTLAGIANKPLSNEVVTALNSRLGELAKQNSLPGHDPTINSALSNLSSDDVAQKSRNALLAATIAQMAANSASSSD